MKQNTIVYLSLAFFITLLLWGIYAYSVYLGIPVHDSVLLTGEGNDLVRDSCSMENETLNYACRGLVGFFPFIARVFGRLAMFQWHLWASLGLYGAMLLWCAGKNSRFEFRFRFRPIYILVLFVFCLTSIFTVISFGNAQVNTSNGSQTVPMRQIIKPTKEVYSTVGDEALAALQANYAQLEERGCLREIGSYNNIAPVSMIKAGCVYKSLFTKVFSQLLFLVMLSLVFLSFGRRILRWCRLHTHNQLLELLYSFSIGACGSVVVYWVLALCSLLIMPVGWAALIGMAAISYKDVVYWWRKATTVSFEYHRPWFDPTMLLVWLLISYLAFNFLNVVRPFPIGWDDLGVYLNHPRLLVSYGHIIPQLSKFAWQYNSALGFLLFGYDSPFGATAAMEVNWLAGAWAVLAVYVFTNVLLGRGHGILAAILYYFLPMTGHFSFADMKIDNAVFAASVTALTAVFVASFARKEHDENAKDWRWFMFSGALLGFAFSFKVTAIMIILTSAAVVAGSALWWPAFVGMMGLAFAVLAKNGLNVKDVASRFLGHESSITNDMFIVVMLILAAACIGVCAWKKKDNLLPAFWKLVWLGVGVLVVILPWLMYHNVLAGNVIPKLVLNAPDKFSTYIDHRVTDGIPPTPKALVLPTDLAIDLEHEHCKSTAWTEELDRYWGFDSGPMHYLSLPWRTVMNIDSAGYYVTTMPGLLLFPLLLLLPFFWFGGSRWLRWLFAATAFLILQWILMGNGVIWYGIGMFLGLVVALEVMYAKAPDVLSKWTMGGFIAVAILLMFSNRLWQYEMQRNLFEYSMGKVTYEALRERTIPHYDNIRDVVLERNQTLTDRPYMYRVGTFIPYFVPKNLEIFAAVDHQLDMFNCMYQERDAALMRKRLLTLGINSIVFDTNTATIERDPNGSLHQKVNAFVDFLNNPESGVKTVINDPGAGVAFLLLD